MAHAASPSSLAPVESLLIEDNPADVRLFREALKGLGIPSQVSVLEKSSDVVAFVQQEVASTPQIIVLDSGVPGMSADEIMGSFRTQPAYEKIPVILFSSFDENEGQRRCAQYGAAAYVQKAGDLQTSLDAILAMVRRWGRLDSSN